MLCRSKYRHVYGIGATNDNCFRDVEVSRMVWGSTNKIAANHEYVAYLDQADNSFTLLENEHLGQQCDNLPKVSGHNGTVLDIDFSPFHTNICGSACDDTFTRIWNIPVGGLTKDLVEPAQILQGHTRKVGTIKFHPTADNIVATSSTDFTIKIWDTETAHNTNTFNTSELICCLAWNYEGSLIVSTHKDKQLYLFDPRQPEVAQSAPTLPGIKGTRCIWLGEENLICDVGFSRTAQRIYRILDPRELTKPLESQVIDTSTGIIMPFYDNDSRILFLAGRGDGNLRYYEIKDKKSHYLSEFRTTEPTLGLALRPKISCDVMNCEIDYFVRALRNKIQPIHFYVPRKNDVFQEDLFPDTKAPYPSLDSVEWLHGKNELPLKVSLPYEPRSSAKSARK